MQSLLTFIGMKIELIMPSVFESQWLDLSWLLFQSDLEFHILFMASVFSLVIFRYFFWKFLSFIFHWCRKQVCQTESKILAAGDKLIDFLTFLIDILLSDLDCNDICIANPMPKKKPFSEESFFAVEKNQCYRKIHQLESKTFKRILSNHWIKCRSDELKISFEIASKKQLK